jgi:hypothetical protein
MRCLRSWLQCVSAAPTVSLSLRPFSNAIYVSYLECLPRKGEIHDRLRKMMTTDLRKGWDDILGYLSKLSGT